MMSSKLSLRLMSMTVMATVVLCLVGVDGVQAEEDWGQLRRMRIGDGSDWWFLGEPWSDGRGGLIQPPSLPWNQRSKAYVGQRTTNQDDAIAIYTAKAYADFEAEFEFLWPKYHSGTGFIFRGQDARHYYRVDFPAIGQATRGEHFWALISKVGDSGWSEVLKMEMLHGITTSEKGIWHHARVMVKGNEFRVWVNGRPMSVVVDDTYTKPGYVGLETWGYGRLSTTFRDVRLRGKPAPAKPWDDELEPVQNWFLPFPLGRGRVQPGGIARTGEDELVMSVLALEDPGHSAIVRSTDQGRTWSAIAGEGLISGQQILGTPAGRLLAVYVIGTNIYVQESKDGGETWLEPVKGEQEPFVPPDNAPDLKLAGIAEGAIALHDGTLLAFWVVQPPDSGRYTGKDLHEWGTWENCAYSVRSTDGGKSWSAPVPLNGPPAVGQKYDLCECTSTMQTKEGKVLALVRPIYSPWMWEVWSDDNGESWGPATSGPFPCWAATAMATESGVLLVSGRMPGLGLYASWDSGMTWKCYRVDTGGLWAMGRMIEVAPNLVLYVYMDHYDSDLRAQYLRITEDGVEPLRVDHE